MSRATPQYHALEKKVIEMITQLEPSFPGKIEFTVSDETYRYMANLLEKAQEHKYGEVINPIINPREECATSALRNVVYFTNNQGQRIGEVHLKETTLEVKVLQDSFQPYAQNIKAKYCQI